MSIWLIRAGSRGDFEQKFIQEERVCVTWDNLDINIRNLSFREEFIEKMTAVYPDYKPKGILNWAGQLWPFAHEIAVGDWIVLPLKSQRAIQVGAITSDYQFEPDRPNPFYHWRSVKWITEAIPRDNFGKDLLNSFGAFMTICRIKKNNAEKRLIAMSKNGWKPEQITKAPLTAKPFDESVEKWDLEEDGSDRIAKLIMAKFKGHGLARLVDEILQALYHLAQSGRGRWRCGHPPRGRFG